MKEKQNLPEIKKITTTYPRVVKSSRLPPTWLVSAGYFAECKESSVR